MNRYINSNIKLVRILISVFMTGLLVSCSGGHDEGDYNSPQNSDKWQD